jgi:acyl dehydratase
MQSVEESSMPLVVLDDPQSLKEFVGREIGVTGWLSLTQKRIEQFAEATEDRQWIHLDRERARRESPYGATIAHGFLTLSLVSYFVREAIEIRGGVRMAVNYGLDHVRFPSPIRSESKIRARIAVRTLKELSDAVEVAFNVTIESENSDKPCCVAEWVVRYYH